MERKKENRRNQVFPGWIPWLGTAIMACAGAAFGAGVTVVSPTASETPKLGLTHTISWRNDTTPAAGYVVIQLYRGTEYDQTIASSVFNNGSYPWRVPVTLDTSVSYRIKVMYSTNPNIYGYSAAFKTSDSSGITVTAPAPNDSFFMGNSMYIRWTKYGAGGGYYFNLDLYSGDSLLKTITTSYYGYTSSSYLWSIPSNLDSSKTYRIKVSCTSQPSMAGFSGTFKLLDRWDVRIYEPDSTSTVQLGSYTNIRWRSTAVSGYLRLDLYRRDTLVSLITSSAYITNGYFSWNVPATLIPGSGYSIKASNPDNPARYSFSGAFTITPAPKIVVGVPAASSSFSYGDSMGVQWKSEGAVGTAVSVALYKGYYLQQSLTASTPNNGFFSWIVPTGLAEGTDYKIRVTGGSVYGESETFYIGPGASKVVFLPDSGSVFSIGDILPIAWRSLWFSSSPYDAVEISLYRGESLVTQITPKLPNQGKHQWTITGTLQTASLYRISVKSLSNPAKSAFSPSFTISNTPQLAITTPTENAVVEADTYAYLFWNGKGQLGTIRFSYSLNQGQSWTVFDSSQLASGRISWKVPSPAAISPALLRAASSSAPPVADSVAITIGVRPKLLQPLAASDAGCRPTFVWSSVKKNEVYTLQIDSLGNFMYPLISLQIQDTSYKSGADFSPGRYFWRVVPSSLPSLPSLTQYFTVPDPRIPILIAVQPNPTTDRRPMFRWHKVPNAQNYSILIAANAGFYNPLIAIPLSDTAYKPSIDLPIGPIYWKVRSNLLDVYSAAQRFEIQTDSIPMLCRYNGSFAASNKPVFKWFKAPGAPSYRIEIFDSLGMKQGKVMIATFVSDTQFTPLAPLGGGIYFWRVGSNLKTVLYSTWDSVRVKPPMGVVSVSGIPRHAGVRIKSITDRLVIQYGQPEAAPVDIAVFTIEGKRVARLSALHGPGSYRWTPQADLSARMYIVAAMVGGKKFVEKVRVMP